MAIAGEEKKLSATPNQALSVGEKILALRKRYGLSQRELARRAEMTNSSLSTIEQGKASPSIASLEKILSAIPISLQAFFAEDLDITPPVQRAEEFLLIKKEGMENRVMPLGEGASQLARQTYAPGAQIHSEWMVRQGFVGGILIQGELHLKLEGTDYLLREGDGFYFALNRSHAFHNKSNKECVVVSVSFTR